MHFESISISETRLLQTWATSEGGPGLNCGEHKAGNSTFVTMYPQSGLSAFGSANSLKKKCKLHYIKS